MKVSSFYAVRMTAMRLCPQRTEIVCWFSFVQLADVTPEEEEKLVLSSEVLNRLADANETWYEHILVYDLLHSVIRHDKAPFHS